MSSSDPPKADVNGCETPVTTTEILRMLRTAPQGEVIAALAIHFETRPTVTDKGLRVLCRFRDVLPAEPKAGTKRRRRTRRRDDDPHNLRG